MFIIDSNNRPLRLSEAEACSWTGSTFRSPPLREKSSSAE